MYVCILSNQPVFCPDSRHGWKLIFETEVQEICSSIYCAKWQLAL